MFLLKIKISLTPDITLLHHLHMFIPKLHIWSPLSMGSQNDFPPKNTEEKSRGEGNFMVKLSPLPQPDDQCHHQQS